jgi:hypothetical protein
MGNAVHVIWIATGEIETPAEMIDTTLLKPGNAARTRSRLISRRSLGDGGGMKYALVSLAALIAIAQPAWCQSYSVDTSSYPRSYPAPSALDIASKYQRLEIQRQQIEMQRLQIEQQRLQMRKQLEFDRQQTQAYRQRQPERENRKIRSGNSN